MCGRGNIEHDHVVEKRELALPTPDVSLRSRVPRVLRCWCLALQTEMLANENNGDVFAEISCIKSNSS